MTILKATLLASGQVTIEIDGLLDEIGHVFPSLGSTLSPKSFLDPHLVRLMDDIYEVSVIREEFSISGAMRWPWSQEAAMIGAPRNFRIL